MNKIYKFIALFISLAFPLTLVTPSNAEIQPFIIGGTNANIIDYPFQMALFFDQNNNNAYGFICGGVLIDDNWVLTAAHCLDQSSTSDATPNYAPPSRFRIAGGKSELDSYIFTDLITVQDIIVNPNARKINQGTAGSPSYILSSSDIALLKLSANPPHPAKKISQIGNSDGNTAGPGSIITGWGTTAANSKTASNTLQVGNVNVKADSICSALPANGGYGTFFEPLIQICAQGGTSSARVDVCSGDSGGPLAYLVSGTDYSLTGITSYGDAVCGTRPGVFTKVSAFTTWINDGKTGKGDLTALSASNLSFNETFSATTTSYSASVSNAISSTSITATAVTDSTVQLFRGVSGETVFDGSLSVGSNLIRAVVSTTNGPVKTYSISITRAATPPSPTPTPAPPPPSSGGGGVAPAPPPALPPAPAAVTQVTPGLESGIRVAGQRWTVTTSPSGVTEIQATVGTQFRGKNAVFFQRLKNGRLIRVGTGRIGRLGRANLETNVRFREGQKIRVQVDGRFRSTVTIRN
jgi:secreted trypsin-like serine protease